MKRRLVLIAIFLMVLLLALTACGGGDSSAVNNDSSGFNLKELVVGAILDVMPTAEPHMGPGSIICSDHNDC